MRGDTPVALGETPNQAPVDYRYSEWMVRGLSIDGSG